MHPFFVLLRGKFLTIVRDDGSGEFFFLSFFKMTITAVRELALICLIYLSVLQVGHGDLDWSML